MEKLRKFLFVNTSTRQTIVKNTLWLFGGEIAGRLLKLAIVLFATRKLGVEGWGFFSYGLAFISLFFMLSDLGVNTFTAREMAKNEDEKYRYLSSSTIIKISLLLLSLVIALVIAPHFGKIRIGFEMIATLSILFLSDGIREFALSINRSLQKMEREAFSKILMNTIITVLGIVLITNHATPLSLAIAYATGSMVASLYICWSIKDILRNVKWKISKADVRIIYDFSWPIIAIGLFSFVFNIDAIMLGQMKSTTEVGLYAAAQRLVQFTAIIPSFIGMSIFPIFSKNHTDKEKLTAIFEKIMILILAIGIPLAIGGFLLGTKIMPLIFGQTYISGGSTLSILMISLLASFPNAILMNAIFAKNLQKIFITATLFGVLVNIALNFLLIPRYGTIGAALSVAVTQLLIMTINWQRLKKILSFSVVPRIGRIIASCLIMAAGILVLDGTGMSPIITILIAIGIYGLSLYALREPALDEILSLIKNS
ncbi:MAG: flippase [bacterium]